MDDITSRQPAPISQLMLTVKFAPSAQNLTVRDYAELSTILGVGLPVFQQIGRAGPMPVGPDELDFDFGAKAPRIQMLSGDLSEYVMLQDDRITFGWSRVRPYDGDPGYPGFSYILTRLQECFGILSRYLNTSNRDKLSPAVGEVIYVDVFVMQPNSTSRWRLEDVFTVYKSHENFRFNEVDLTFRKAHLEALKGNSETKVWGPTRGANNEFLMNLATTIRFNLSEHDDLPKTFGLARGEAAKIFKTLVKAAPGPISQS